MIFPFASMAVPLRYQEEDTLLLHCCMTTHGTIICQDTDCSSRSDIYLKRKYHPVREDLQKEWIPAERKVQVPALQLLWDHVHSLWTSHRNTVFPFTSAISALLLVKDRSH